VADLLHLLDSVGLWLASGDSQLRLPITSPTLFDPLMPLSGPRSGILLGIGLHPEAPASAEVIREAARRGFGALVIKSFSLSVEALAEVADSAGIALLIADDEIEWRQLDALINSALDAAMDADDSLSALVVGDLFALANAISAMVGGATTIEDMKERVLAYSTLSEQKIDSERRDGILGRQVPKLPANIDQYAAVFNASGAIRIAGKPPLLSRLAIAVRAGSRALGSIWVVDAAGDLDSDAERALEHAADIAALHLLRARSSVDLVRQQRAELVRGLFESEADAGLLAEQLELDTSGPFVLVAFQPQFALDGEDLQMSRLLDLIAVQCEAHEHGSECVVIGNTVYVLFSGTRAVRGLEGLARRLIARADSALRISVRVAIGTIVTTISQITRSKHDADLVLLLLANRKMKTNVASALDVQSQLTLIELARVFRNTPQLVSRQAEAVLNFDARTGTSYANTIRTYLDCSRNSAETANRLSLHQNTLRYRLRRVGELFEIDLDNPDDTLTLWLSLRVMKFD
jgi:DNA-binding PucR family transcriptional regulator